MKRRNFIKATALSSGGLLISINYSCQSPVKNEAPGVFSTFNSYLRIDTNGLVEILNPVPEIGQGVANALPLLVAEELDINWEQVVIKQADAGEQFEGRNQRAAGSNSVRTFWQPMRIAGATAREMIKAAAAQTWNLSADQCHTQMGVVRNDLDNRTMSYGELVELAATLAVPEDVTLKSPSEFKLIGTATTRPLDKQIVTGQTKFGLDTRVEGMLYASIEKCKTYGATVLSFNKEEVLARAGITHCFKVPYHGSSMDRPYCREGVAVVGNSVWQVLQARKALNIEWDLGSNQNENSDRLHKVGLELLTKPGKYLAKDDGSALSNIGNAHETLEATYHMPFIVHIPMEVLNCTVDLKEDSCELWSTTQMPNIELNYVANYLELPPDKVKIHIPRIGGGFGRRLGVDWTLEALKIAQEVKQPVHCFWNREDDIQMDGCRPFSYHQLRAGINEQGKVTSWLHRQSGTSRYAFRENNEPHQSEFFPNHFPANLISNFRQEYNLLETNVERSLIRAPGNNALAFPVESFIDELAHKLQKDPLKFRLDLLGSDAEFLFEEESESVISTQRMRAVLKKAAEMASWGKSLPDGHGMGIAGYFTFDSYVAHVAEVAVDASGNLSITSFNSAVDCGQVLSPDGVVAQVEGAIIDGLSATLYQEATISDGGIDQTNFDNYQVLRMSDAPSEINVSFIENDYPPTGMGEPPYPPVAPALCNAIYAACGVRIRQLPIKGQLVSQLTGV